VNGCMLAEIRLLPVLRNEDEDRIVADLSSTLEAGKSSVKSRDQIVASSHRPEPESVAGAQTIADLAEGLDEVGMCPKLCGGQLRQVDSPRWGRYWRCRKCGHECRHLRWRPDSHI
jgi:hypothetical protein